MSAQNSSVPFPLSSAIPANPEPKPTNHPSPGDPTKPLESLDAIIARELEKTGLAGIDDNLLKVLLIRNLSLNTSGVSMATNSLVSNQLQWHQLGQQVSPQLLIDGSNFPLWSASIINVVRGVTQRENYFDDDHSATDPATSNGVLSLLQNSIDPALRSSLNGMTAYGAFKSLKGQFAGTSWSLILSHWADVSQVPDTSDSLSAGYEAIKRSWFDLEERLGGLTADKLISLSFHTSAKRYQQQLADSVDSRLAINPQLQIKSDELLHMATRMHQSATALGLVSAMEMTASLSRGGSVSSGRGGRSRGNFRGGRGSFKNRQSPAAPESSSSTPPPDNWAKQYLVADFPCNICWEWGHWAPDCPRVKNGLPPMDDPRKKNPGWRPKNSNVLSGRLVTSSGELASVSVLPEDQQDILCDTGATHHNGFP